MGALVVGIAGLAGLFVLFGAIIALIGGILLAVMKGREAHILGPVTAIGVILVLGGLFLAPLATTTNTGPSTAPSTAKVQIVKASAPALNGGCSTNLNTYVITCPVEYNKTSNAFCTVTTIATTNACKTSTGFLAIAFKEIRTDAVNTTFLFSSTLQSLPVVNSLGSTPTQYSLIGYTAGTSTQNGVWQVSPSAGTLAAQKPSANAPGVNSGGVETTGLAIQSFGSASIVWNFAFAGTNSTSAPVTFAEALTNFTAYNIVINFSNLDPSQPAGEASWTVALVMEAWTT